MYKKLFFACIGLLCTSLLYAQTKINGLVTDEVNMPLAGVSVSVKNTKRGTATDSAGRFTLQADKGEIIEFSHTGMVSKTVVVGNDFTINIQLISAAVNLNDVVIIGYGSTKKSDLTGSVTTIKPDGLKNARVGTATSALQGLAAGVFVSTGSVKPGGDASVVIRGSGSLRAGNAPLYVVDGIPVEGGLQDLSQGDIESIEVLKDASSAAIYGSRGSNGVILVTTRKGVKGKGRVTLNVNSGTQRMLNKQKMMNAQQYYELASKAVPDYTWTSEELRLLSRGESTDWQDAITQNGSFSNYNLGISGGNEKVTHFLGADYYNQIGTIKNSSFRKVTLRYNMDAQTMDWLRTGIRFNIIESKLKNINEEGDSGYGTMFSAISSQPTAPIFTSNGDYFDGFLNTKANPVAIVDLLDKSTAKSRAVGSVYFEIEPIKNLKIRSDNGAELEFFNVNSYEDGRMGQHYPDGGHAVKFNGKKRYMQTENTATYNFELSDRHRFVVMGGFSASKYDYESTTADSKNLSPILGYDNLGGAQNHGPNYSYASASTLTSYYGRVNYNFDDRYLFTVTMRQDGSSRFAPGHRWGFFPSAALAWRISNEQFMENAGAVSELKLRLSAGKLGNQNIGDYAYAATIGQGGEWADYVFGGNLATGSVQNTIANPNLTWEKANQFDIGIDFGFFKNRIAGTLDAYYKKTTDLLWLVPLPIESGFDNSLTNIGQIDNKGIELSLTTVNISTRDFSWTTAGNISYNQNKIAELYGGKLDVNKSLFVGQPINLFYTLKSDGIWQTSEAAQAAQYNAQPGDRKVVDVNKDGVINGDDRQFAGVAVPKFYGSFTNTFKYKGFDLITFFTYAGGHMINNSLNRYLNAFNTWGNMGVDYYNGYWTPTRPSQRYPAPRVGSPYANGDGTDANLQKGDYLRLRNIELGYSFPASSFVRRIKSTGMRVYASVQNAFTWTQFTGYDVESGDNTNPYPNARTFMAGLSINF
ncbi:MAG: TonB-dependent receptor [Sphingobacteriales bacterium]|nr:TonB-dependent receptor [Sphingobacteriales bacterium]OJW34281.1 MAG: SusC/RagA family TonB-linked outer membrane protein [Sphingobacteriales bacterium 46-32]